MKILVLGATGKTGREVTDKALAAGHTVTAFTRSPGKLTARDRLMIFNGDAEDSAQVEAAASGQDAVISALGHTSVKHSAALTTATKALIKVLPPNTKVISLTGFGVVDSHDPAISWTGRLLNRAVMLIPGDMFNDGARHVELLRHSDLNWTVIRAAILINGSGSGRYELGYFSLTPKDTIARADVAAAMVACLTDDSWKYQAPMIRPLKS